MAYHDPRWRRDRAPLLDHLGAVIDHIEAFARGGLHDEPNFVTSCNKCNVRKNSAEVSEFEKRSSGMWPSLFSGLWKFGGPYWNSDVEQGEFLIPIAAAGLPVVGLDVSAEFLACAVHKSKARGLKIELHQADARDFRLGRLFELVLFPFRAIGTMLTVADVTRCFGCVRAHLAPGGLFILDAFNAQKAIADEGRLTFSYVNPDTQEPMHVECEKTYARDSRIETATFRFMPTGHIRQLRLRYHTLNELTDALRDQGLGAIEHLGGYAGEPASSNAPCSLIFSKPLSTPSG